MDFNDNPIIGKEDGDERTKMLGGMFHIAVKIINCKETLTLSA